MLIGVLIGISPWLAEQQVDQAVMWNAVLVGALVLLLCRVTLACSAGRKPARVLGLWLIASPFTFGYAETGALWLAFRLGAIVVLLAALELWQWHWCALARQGAYQAWPITRSDTCSRARTDVALPRMTNDNHHSQQRSTDNVRL